MHLQGRLWVVSGPWHPGFPPSVIVPSTDLQVRCHGSELMDETCHFRTHAPQQDERSCTAIRSSRRRSQKRRRHVEAERLRHDQVNDEVDLVDRSTGRSAGFAPEKSCQPNRRRAAKVDEGHRADEDREFLFFVADVPDADYFTRCVLYWVITGLVQLTEDVDCAVESLTFVDIHYRFSLRVQDGPKRPALYAARHIGGYADIIITRLYEKRSRAAGLSLDPVDNREVVVHLG